MSIGTIMNILTDYVVPFGVIFTFIGTIVTIYITRRIAKSTKYIDTITSERIKWIEKIRLELADLNSIFLIIIKDYHLILELEANKDEHNDVLLAADTLRRTSELNREITSFSRSDILRKINTIRLRLNPVEDEKLLNCLHDLNLFILLIHTTREDVIKAWKSNSTLIDLTQDMLKQEWEKVKREARS